jgi:hypothetical protein
MPDLDQRSLEDRERRLFGLINSARAQGCANAIVSGDPDPPPSHAGALE